MQKTQPMPRPKTRRAAAPPLAQPLQALLLSTCALIALVLALTAGPAVAHPGGLAADGCHYCRTNCAQWGLIEGERHCDGQTSPHAAQDRPREVSVEIRGSTPRIVDADTLVVAGERVRLQGVDAPESRQSCRRAGTRYPCGEEATEALRRQIGAGAVMCTIHGRDRYERALGICQDATGTDLNGWLVRQGWALAYRRYSTMYVPQENQAKAARAGMWAGEFVEPWKWRRGARLN